MAPGVYILQRGVQWKQGVVICMVLYTILLYDTTPIHCTPLRLHPPLMNIQRGCAAPPGHEMAVRATLLDSNSNSNSVSNSNGNSNSNSDSDGNNNSNSNSNSSSNSNSNSKSNSKQS